MDLETHDSKGLHKNSGVRFQRRRLSFLEQGFLKREIKSKDESNRGSFLRPPKMLNRLYYTISHKYYNTKNFLSQI